MRRQLPSLQNLLCFESVAKHASYTHASQELFITQSAVSRQIQQLESFLGVQLFNRTRYGVKLTDAGKKYAESIRPYLIGLEQCTADMISHKGMGGTLKLGVVPTFATRWLLPKLHDFTQQYPEITIQLETSTKPFLFNEHTFDAAIFAGTQEQVTHWPGITAHYLLEEIIVPVCSPKLIERLFPSLKKNNNCQFELTDEQLVTLPLLQQTTRPLIWQEWFHAHLINHPKPFDGQRHELFSMLSVAASQSMGMALIPKMLIENELNSGELSIVSDKKLEGSRAYYVVHSSQDSSAIIEKFIDWIQQFTAVESNSR